jgi:predicted dehydrogenase
LGRPDYAVIATETSHHHQAIGELAAADFAGLVMVEKPLFHRPEIMPPNRFERIGVGYPMRSSGAMLELRTMIAGEHVVSAQIHCGSYLPRWRDGRDYRHTESASAALGGGVLRDLSHELDYALWLFGPWLRLTAVNGKFGSLEIDSDDTAAILVEFARCDVGVITLNYLDAGDRRGAIVITAKPRTLELVFEKDRTEVTRAMHSDFLNDQGNVCTVDEGIAVIEMIAAIEKAARHASWVRA